MVGTRRHRTQLALGQKSERVRLRCGVVVGLQDLVPAQRPLALFPLVQSITRPYELLRCFRNAPENLLPSSHLRLHLLSGYCHTSARMHVELH